MLLLYPYGDILTVVSLMAFSALISLERDWSGRAFERPLHIILALREYGPKM